MAYENVALFEIQIGMLVMEKIQTIQQEIEKVITEQVHGDVPDGLTKITGTVSVQLNHIYWSSENRHISDPQYLPKQFTVHIKDGKVVPEAEAFQEPWKLP